MALPPDPASPPTPPTPTPTDLTWPALLAKWTQFAQATSGLPREGEGSHWRASVPAIIALQSIVFALRDLESLPAGERPAARVRAGVIIDRHAADLAALWATPPVPLQELVDDARGALAASGSGPSDGSPTTDPHAS